MVGALGSVVTGAFGAVGTIARSVSGPFVGAGASWFVPTLGV